MDNSGIVIIIDNNAANGKYLYRCCTELLPDAEVCWLMVCPADEPTLTGGLYYFIERELESAARFIDEKIGDKQDIIVFYNPQLGMLQRNVATAIDSQVTQALRRMVDEGRRILINLHSTDMPTREIAKFIDSRFESWPLESRVISHHLITGASPRAVRAVVAETLDEWRGRFAGTGTGERAWATRRF